MHNKSLLLEYSKSQKMVIANNVQLKATLDSMQLNDLLQNWILCSSMWSSTTLDWGDQRKLGSMQPKTASFGLRIMLGNCTLGLGVACSTLQVKISMFLWWNPLLPEPTQTAISSASFYCKPWLKKGLPYEQARTPTGIWSIRAPFTANYEWMRDWQMVEGETYKRNIPTL